LECLTSSFFQKVFTMPQLDQNEVHFFEELREAGVLEDVNGNCLDTSKGVILVTCADGSHFGDIFKRQSEMTPLIHTLALNGGGLILPHRSPANMPIGMSPTGGMICLGDIYMSQISVAQELKGISVVALHVHFPCGIARLHNIGSRHLMELLVAAKTRIKAETSEGTKVAACLHIAWPDGRKRTYFVSRDKWTEYLQATGSQS